MVPLRLISAGAGESIVKSLKPEIGRAGVELNATFGPVGVIRETFTESDDCQLLITSKQGMDDLEQTSHLDASQIADLGSVQTAVAVRDHDFVPDCSTAEAFEQLVRTTPALYYPDANRSTAGAHFRRVLKAAGIEDWVRETGKTYPNGATAMRALAASDLEGAVGCTQITEILQTEGVIPAGPLPPPYELTTVYQCALIRRGGSADNDESFRVFELLTGSSTRALRESLGFR